MMQLDIVFVMEEKHMKKWIALVLTVVLITTLTACSHAENTETIAYHDMVFPSLICLRKYASGWNGTMA